MEEGFFYCHLLFLLQQKGVVVGSSLQAGVNFTNILRAAFVPLFLPPQSTNLKCKYK
jgi:hypothetical protein